MIKSALYDTAHNPYAGCTICHRQDGPYISPGAFGDETGNKIYYCKRCVTSLAESFSLPTDHDVAQLRGIVDELTEQCERAQSEIEQLKANMSVPLAEVIDFVREREKRRPETVKTA